MAAFTIQTERERIAFERGRQRGKASAESPLLEALVHSIVHRLFRIDDRTEARVLHLEGPGRAMWSMTKDEVTQLVRNILTGRER